MDVEEIADKEKKQERKNQINFLHNDRETQARVIYAEE